MHLASDHEVIIPILMDIPNGVCYYKVICLLVDVSVSGLEGFGLDGKYRGKIQVNTALGKTGFPHLIPT